MVVTIVYSNRKQTTIDSVIQVINTKYSVSFICSDEKFINLFHDDLEGYIVEGRGN